MISVTAIQEAQQSAVAAFEDFMDACMDSEWQQVGGWEVEWEWRGKLVLAWRFKGIMATGQLRAPALLLIHRGTSNPAAGEASAV